MELRIDFPELPGEMDLAALRRGLDEVLEDDGWLTGSGEDENGHYLELELEDEKVNPKHCIVAVRGYLCGAGFPRDTALELAGVATNIYG